MEAEKGVFAITDDFIVRPPHAVLTVADSPIPPSRALVVVAGSAVTGNDERLQLIPLEESVRVLVPTEVRDTIFNPEVPPPLPKTLVQQPVQRVGTMRPLTRRKLLRDALLFPFAVLTTTTLATGCSPSESRPDGSEEFADQLMRKIEIQDDWDRKRIVEFIKEKTRDKNWMVNTDLGSIKTPAGIQQFSTDGIGEVILEIHEKNVIDYFTPRAEDMATPEEVLFETTTARMYVYGSSQTKGEFRNLKPRLSEFMKLMSSYANGKKIIFHLNFQPYGMNAQYRGIPAEQLPQANEVAGATKTRYDKNSQSGKYEASEFHVILNMNLIHTAAKLRGEDPQIEFTNTLANEVTNVIGREGWEYDEKVSRLNEAPSSIFGLLAAFKKNVAGILMGDGYQPLVDQAVKSMEDAEALGKKLPQVLSPAGKLSRRGFLAVLTGTVLNSIDPIKQIIRFGFGVRRIRYSFSDTFLGPVTA